VQRETIHPGQSDSVAEVAGVGGGALPPQFGRYRLEECLGQGAMGAVYKAHDSQLDRLIAIKIPKFDAADTALLERFYREARAAATLSHPNICPVFDVGEIGGTHYISMGYIEGKPLSAFIRPDKPLSEKQAVMIIRKLAVALYEAHGKGIVHRDLKPDNVMIDQRSNPVIMDFGLARRSTGTDDIRVTQGGQMLGTPAYMSPEQVEGDVDRMGPCCDIYSVGVILYELLTGRLPYEGSIASVLAQIIKGEPKQPVQFRDKLNPELQAICLKMMASELGDRYASMADVARDLGAIIKGKPTSVRDSMAGVTSPGMATQDEGLSQLIAVDDVPVSARTSRKSRVRSSQAQSAPAPKGRLPSWAIWSGAAAAGIAILLAGYTLFVKVGDKTVRIQIDDPEAQLFVDGGEVRIENLGATIELKPGKHGVEIRRGDIIVQADQFTVLKGNNPVLKLEVLDRTKPAQDAGPSETATSSTTAAGILVPPVIKSRPATPVEFAESDDPVLRAVGWALSHGIGLSVNRDSNPGSGFQVMEFEQVPNEPFKVSGLRPTDAMPTGLSDTEWEHIDVLLPGVGEIRCQTSRFPDELMTRLVGAPKLKRFFIEKDGLTDKGFGMLNQLKKLNGIWIGKRETPDSVNLSAARMASLATIRGDENVTVTVKNCTLGDAAAAALSRGEYFTNLNLQNCRISAPGIEYLGQMTLDSLDLTGTPLNDTSARPLGNIKALESLILKNTGVGDGTVKLASGLPQLQRLDLSDTRVGDAQLSTLRDLPRLFTLVLDRTRVSDDGLKQLESLTSLQRLSLRSTVCSQHAVTSLRNKLSKCTIDFTPAEGSATPAQRPSIPQEFSESDNPVRRAVGWAISRNFSLHIISDGGPQPIRTYDDVPDGPLQVGSLIIAKDRPIESEDWHHLKALRGLNSLVVRDGRFDDAALAHLADSPDLKILQLLDTSVTDAGLHVLTTMPALEELLLGTQNPERRATRITDEVLTSISQIPKLRKLNLSSCAITDECLETLANLDGLRELSLRHCGLTDSGVEHLSDLKLQTLHLQGNTITDASAQAISEIKTLESLTLKGTEAGDTTFRQLCSLPRLHLLDMEGTKVTDAGLDEVSKLRRLQTLVLSRTAISDAGLTKLHELRGLRTLSLRETHCSVDGIAAFEAACKNCKVSFSQAADAPVASISASPDATATKSPAFTVNNDDKIPEFYAKNPNPELRTFGWMLSRNVKVSVSYQQADGELRTRPVKDFDNVPTVRFVVRDVTIQSDSRIKPTEWAFLKALPNLDGLTVYLPDFDDAALSFLVGHPVLTRIQLINTRVTDDGLQPLTTIPGLSTVELSCFDRSKNITHFSDEAMKYLVRIPKLRSLAIKRAALTDDGLRILVNNRPALQNLTLADMELTDEGIIALEKLQRLTLLDLQSLPITDGIAPLFLALPDLTSVNLSRTEVGDNVLAALSRAPKLGSLSISETKITDAGIRSLAGHPQI
jgi:serine/threonine protein kinase/Leucine-rich repeat (LRR) protein